jgi:hypothetical protein
MSARAARTGKTIRPRRPAGKGDRGGADNDINTQRAAHMILAKSYTILGNAAESKKEQRWIEQHPNPETRKDGKD